MMDLDKELKNLKEDGLKAPKEFEDVMREAYIIYFYFKYKYSISNGKKVNWL